jgi:hypothetical protein
MELISTINILLNLYNNLIVYQNRIIKFIALLEMHNDGFALVCKTEHHLSMHQPKSQIDT